jgi:hypothetical protein
MPHPLRFAHNPDVVNRGIVLNYRFLKHSFLEHSRISLAQTLRLHDLQTTRPAGRPVCERHGSCSGVAAKISNIDAPVHSYKPSLGGSGPRKE